MRIIQNEHIFYEDKRYGVWGLKGNSIFDSNKYGTSGFFHANYELFDYLFIIKDIEIFNNAGFIHPMSLFGKSAEALRLKKCLRKPSSFMYNDINEIYPYTGALLLKEADSLNLLLADMIDGEVLDIKKYAFEEPSSFDYYDSEQHKNYLKFIEDTIKQYGLRNFYEDDWL